jgi:hypothetical protein
LFDTAAADISPAGGSNMVFTGNSCSVLAGEKTSVDDIHADKPTSEKSTSDNRNPTDNQIDHDNTTVPPNSVMGLSNPKDMAEYSGPMDVQSARIRMGDALFLYEWKFPADNESDESSHKVYYLILRCTTRTTSSNLLTALGFPRF